MSKTTEPTQRVRHELITSVLIACAGVAGGPSCVDNNTASPETAGEHRPPTGAVHPWPASAPTTVVGALADPGPAAQRQQIDAKASGALGDGSCAATPCPDGIAIQNALDAAAATTSGVFGGTVYLPKGTYVISTPLVIPNGVGLRGDNAANTVIKASGNFNGSSLISNKMQNGTQEYAFLDSLQINGNAGGGAVCSEAVVSWGSLFINSTIRNTVIFGGSAVGLHVFASGTPGGTGPVLIENTWVFSNGTHNVYVEDAPSNTGAVAGLVFVNLTSENQGSNSSAIYLKGNGRAGQTNFYNTHIEEGGSQTHRTGITIDGFPDVTFTGVQLQAGTPTNVDAGISITNAVQNVRIQIRAVTNINLINPVLNDAKNNITIGPTAVPWYVTPEADVQGGLRFKPSSAGISAAFQNSAGADKVWFDSSGSMAGSSVNESGLNLKGDATNNRPLTFDDSDNHVFGVKYPAASGGVLRWSYTTGGVDISQWGTDGSTFWYQPATFQSPVTLGSGLSAASKLNFTNEVVPPAITTSQNDYNPTNLGTAAVLVLSSTAAVNITGLAGGTSGRTLWVYNNGINNITLTSQDASSATANRFIGRGAASMVLTANTGVHLYYSPSISRWLVLGDAL